MSLLNTPEVPTGNYLLDRIKKLAGSGRTAVELGCGTGYLIEAISKQFDHCIGIDVSMRRLESRDEPQSNAWQFRQANLNEAFPIADASVDTVLANQVIEHIIDPYHFATEIFRILRPGGAAIITTPNIRYIKNIGKILLTGHGPRTAGGNTIDGAWDDGHLHYFTHRDLRELFTKTAFAHIQSCALVDLSRPTVLRKLANTYASSWPIRELFSGVVLLHVIK